MSYLRNPRIMIFGDDFWNRGNFYFARKSFTGCGSITSPYPHKRQKRKEPLHGKLAGTTASGGFTSAKLRLNVFSIFLTMNRYLTTLLIGCVLSAAIFQGCSIKVRNCIFGPRSRWCALLGCLWPHKASSASRRRIDHYWSPVAWIVIGTAAKT